MSEIILEEFYNENNEYLGKVVIDSNILKSMKSDIQNDNTNKMGYRKYKDIVNNHFREQVIK